MINFILWTDNSLLTYLNDVCMCSERVYTLPGAMIFNSLIYKTTLESWKKLIRMITNMASARNNFVFTKHVIILFQVSQNDW